MNTIKRIIIYSVTLIAAMFFAASCTKEDSLNNQIPLKYANEENPYEWIGIAHNDILYSIGTSLQETLMAYLQKDSLTHDDFLFIEDTFMVVARNLMEQYATEVSVDDILSGIYSDTSNTSINIDSLAYAILIEATSQFEDATGMIELTRIKEAEILHELYPDDPSTDTVKKDPAWVEQRELTLATLSVFRNSLSFWEDAMVNDANPWHGLLVNELDIPKQEPTVGALIPWFKRLVSHLFPPMAEKPVANIAAYDAAGALMGFASFGLSGACITGATYSGLGALGSIFQKK